MNIKKIFGENLKYYRKKLNLTQEELAEKLEISINHLSKIELGNRFISSELLEKIYEKLDISPAALFFNPAINGNLDDNKISEILNTIDKNVAQIKSDIWRKIT